MTAHMTEINGIHFQRVYYLANSKGLAVSPKGRYEIKEPPTLGWSSAFIIHPDNPEESHRRKKASTRLTLFSPFTFEAFQITSSAREIADIDPEPLSEDRLEVLERIMHTNWEMYTGFGFQKDYDVAALVLNRLGRRVPNTVTPAQEVEYSETHVPNRHGKPVGETLIRPIDRTSRRGTIAQFFMTGGSIREAMAKFDMSRSGVLTHLHGLNKDHGIGYVLQGDMAHLMLPAGCTDPLADPEEAKAQVVTKSVERAGKPCRPVVTPLPAKGKRREVALAMLEDKALAEVAEAIGCSVNSVRSHLHDLHTKHGFGYEFSADKSRGKLIVPTGWTPEDTSFDDLDPLA